jgi:hypothetical protein
MKKNFFLILVLCFTIQVYSQNARVAAIYGKLQGINSTIVGTSCTSKYGLIVSDNGLNVFFADKIASYLSEEGDISLYKTYATLDASDGKLIINHNIHAGKSSTGRIKSLTTIGTKANIEDGFASIFSGEKFNSELGISFKQTWFAKGRTFFDGCAQKQQKAAPGPLVPSAQKQKMNIERALIINQLRTEMESKATEFEVSVNAITGADVPGAALATVHTDLRNEFYKKLEEEYLKKFAEQEAEKLSETESYNLIKTNWTSIDLFIPVTTQKFSVAETYLTNFDDRSLFPWQISVFHNRIWESRRCGRFFLNLSGGVFNSNSVATEEVEKIVLEEYKNLGGTDTLHLAQIESDDAYIGKYKNFASFFIKAQGVWFPKKWNVGFSLSLEQNFGHYNPLNGKFGIPIRLNDKDGDPTVNFEIQVRAFDMRHNIQPDKSFGKKTSVGLSVGLPFSSLIY